MKIDFIKIQQAFVDGIISMEELIQILVDNFGSKKTIKIISDNLKIAIEKQNKS